MKHKYRAEKTSGGLLYFSMYQISHDDYDPENGTFGVAIKLNNDIWEIVKCKIGTEEQYICLDSSNNEIYENDIIQWLGFEVRKGKQIMSIRKFVVDKIESKYKLACLLSTTVVKKISRFS